MAISALSTSNEAHLDVITADSIGDRRPIGPADDVIALDGEPMGLIALDLLRS